MSAGPADPEWRFRVHDLPLIEGGLGRGHPRLPRCDHHPLAPEEPPLLAGDRGDSRAWRELGLPAQQVTPTPVCKLLNILEGHGSRSTVHGGGSGHFRTGSGPKYWRVTRAAAVKRDHRRSADSASNRRRRRDRALGGFPDYDTPGSPAAWA